MKCVVRVPVTPQVVEVPYSSPPPPAVHKVDCKHNLKTIQSSVFRKVGVVPDICKLNQALSHYSTYVNLMFHDKIVFTVAISVTPSR